MSKTSYTQVKMDMGDVGWGMDDVYRVCIVWNRRDVYDGNGMGCKWLTILGYEPTDIIGDYFMGLK